MSTLNLSFKNNSGYDDSYVYIYFYGDSGCIKQGDNQIELKKWYSLSTLSSGVGISSFSGRIYVAFGNKPKYYPEKDLGPNLYLDSFYARYDKVEITFNGRSGDVADLTSIDFWSIPMDLITSKDGIQADVVKGLKGIDAKGLYKELVKLTTPPKSTIDQVKPALVPGEFPPKGSDLTFARIMGPGTYPDPGGAIAFPYQSFENYLGWLNDNYGKGTGTNIVPGLGNGVIATIAGKFNGVGSVPPPTGSQSRQTYNFTANIDDKLNITLTGTLGNSPETVTIVYSKEELLKPVGIYGANPRFSINGGDKENQGNNVYSWITGDLLAGMNIGAVGSQVEDKKTGKKIGAMSSSEWFFGNMNSAYMFSGAQPDHSENYNQYAEVIHKYSDAYGFAYAERFAHVTASLDPAVVDELTICFKPSSDLDHMDNSGLQ